MAETRLVQGSTDYAEIRRPAAGGRGGRNAAKAPIRHAGRPTHAVPEGTTTSLCNEKNLLVFKDEWPRGGGLGSSGEWCSKCVAKTTEPR